MALDLLRYHTNPAGLYGTIKTDDELFEIGEFNGKRIFLTPVKYEKKMKWIDAVEYCENLSIDGYSDFRLSNNEELKFIFQNQQKLLMVITVGGLVSFGNSFFGDSFYWSSTEDQDRAWILNMVNGSNTTTPKNYPNCFVRPIRVE